MEGGERGRSRQGLILGVEANSLREPCVKRHQEPEDVQRQGCFVFDFKLLALC